MSNSEDLERVADLMNGAGQSDVLALVLITARTLRRLINHHMTSAQQKDALAALDAGLAPFAARYPVTLEGLGQAFENQRAEIGRMQARLRVMAELLGAESPAYIEKHIHLLQAREEAHRARLDRIAGMVGATDASDIIFQLTNLMTSRQDDNNTLALLGRLTSTNTLSDLRAEVERLVEADRKRGATP